jgi:putative two-component system response regulator
MESEKADGGIERTSREACCADEVKEWDMNFFLPSTQLYDVGKIAISDLIMDKPGKLTPTVPVTLLG